MRKKIAVVACIVCLITVAFFSGLLVGNMDYGNNDNVEGKQTGTQPLDNGRPYRKTPTIIPVDNGRPY